MPEEEEEEGAEAERLEGSLMGMEKGRGELCVAIYADRRAIYGGEC